MILKRAFLFASLCLSLAMGERVLVWSGYPRPFAAGQQGVRPSFQNAKAGDAREVGGVKLRWCPPGRFVMGSPPDEPERRSDEAQVEVRLTKGFWMGEHEVTQGQWKRVAGEFPGKQPAVEGDNFLVCWVNYAEPGL